MSPTGSAILSFFLAVVFFFVVAAIFYAAYNYSLPKMSNGRLPTINYWAALLFLILVSILGGIFFGPSLAEKMGLSVGMWKSMSKAQPATVVYSTPAVRA